jgi:hypothetical protein
MHSAGYSDDDVSRQSLLQWLSRYVRAKLQLQTTPVYRPHGCFIVVGRYRAQTYLKLSLSLSLCACVCGGGGRQVRVIVEVTRAGFHRILRLPLPILILTSAPYLRITRGWRIGRCTEWTQFHTIPRN